MDSLDNKKVVSKEDMNDCLEFVTDFCEELKGYHGRLACSEQETACARAIRNRLHDETDVKTRLEAFHAYPLLGRRMFLLIGIWYAFCLALYYISFAGDRGVGIAMCLVALFAFFGGMAMLISLYTGKRTFKWLLLRKPSFNVVSECGSQENRKVFVVCSSHDEMPGSAIKDFDLMRKACIIGAPISAFVFVLFCILKAAIGTHTGDIVTKSSVFAIIPAIFGIFGIAACVLHYSHLTSHARETNGISTAVSLASYAYFVDKPELMPTNVKLVFASFGAENAGHCGSQAFIDSHPEWNGATVICLDELRSGNIVVCECDPLRKIHYNARTVSALLSSAREQVIPIGVQPHDSFKHKFNALHGYTSNAFAKAGNPTLTMLAKDYSKLGGSFDGRDIETLFALTVAPLQDLMKEAAIEVEENIDTNEMQIVDVVSK